MRTFITVLAIVSVFAAATPVIADDPAPALRAVTHEDVWLMHRLGTPVVSPDGKWAVFSVTEPSYEKDGTVRDLWVVPVDGSRAARRLTSTKSAESDVAWSPDGSRIAFAAKRGEDDDDDDTSQIYVLDMTGPGEAIKLTSWATGAKKPKWSPDGERIAFESRVYPGATSNEENEAEKKRREDLEYNASSYEIFPIRQWDRWRDDRQTHLIVQDAKAGADATDLMAGTRLVEQSGFAGLPTRSGNTLNAEWTPDGSGLVISATTNLHEAAFSKVYYHLYSVSATGDIGQLTESTAWNCHSAQFAPDGKALVCKFEPQTEFAYEMDELARLAWPVRDDPVVLTGNFDRSVGDWHISANGKTVFMTALDHGRSRLYAVPLRGGQVTALKADSAGVYAGPQPAGRSLVARWESSVSPAEIVRVDARNGRHSALTAFNTERASQLDRRPFREFWFESSQGRRIHSFIALPPGFDESLKYPLVLFIHGGPHSSSRDADHVRWSPHLLAAPGYVVLLVDYTGSVGYGEQFSQNIQGDPLKTPGMELIEAADEAIRLFDFIDPDRQAATGASYGGHLVNWLQATTTRFKTLVGHAGLVDLEGQWSSSDVVYHREINNGGPVWGDSTIWREQSPSTYADNFSTPMMLTIGEKDYRVPVNQTIAAWTYLKRQNVPGKLLVFHDANHWIMKAPEAKHYWSEVHEWLARYLQ